MTAISLFAEDAKGRIQQVAVGNSMNAITGAMQEICKKWLKTKKGRTAKIDGLFATLRYSDGKLAQLLVAEPVEVPKGHEPGQPKRKRWGQK